MPPLPLPPGDLHPGTVALFEREFNIPQRTPEWYLARKSLITASDCAAALSIKPFSGFKGSVRKEALDSKFKTWAGNIFCAHGQYWEDHVSKKAADRLKTQIFDFGLMRHPTLEWLGASPDGVTADGCLIEIKCPLRRTITEEVPHHYFPQIQVQLEVCQLEVCWFVQWKPASLNRGTEQLCITKVCRDREWFARHRETLYSFYVDFQEMMRTRQPAPQPEPLPCPIDLTLYGEVQ